MQFGKKTAGKKTKIHIFTEKEQKNIRIVGNDVSEGGLGACVQNSASPVFDSECNITGNVVPIRNITDLQETPKALQENEERYRLLIKTMTEDLAIHEIICNTEGKPVDYRFHDVNPAFEKLTGIKSKNIVGKTVKKVISETEDFWIRTYGEVALTGKSTYFEKYFKPLGRHTEIFAYSPALKQFTVVFSTSTERKLAKVALRRQGEIQVESQEGEWATFYFTI
jgi:PAS domain S-box-containing protein